MSYFRYPGRTVFLVALALALGGTALSAQPRPGRNARPADPAALPAAADRRRWRRPSPISRSP